MPIAVATPSRCVLIWQSDWGVVRSSTHEQVVAVTDIEHRGINVGSAT